MVAATDQLLQSPRLPIYVERLVALLRAEHEARQIFRARVTANEDWRAEFINGEVVELMSTKEKHLQALHVLTLLLGLYIRKTKLGRLRTENALTAFVRNDYLPDICFWTSVRAAAITPDTVVFPVPDFIIEILSDSTAHRDRGVKFEDYAAQGVREYWIVDPELRTIEQFISDDGAFKLLQKHDASGRIRCSVLEGLEFPTIAAFDEDFNLASIPSLA